MKRFREEQGNVLSVDIGISGGNVYGSIGTLESISKEILEKDMKAIRVKNGTNSILCGTVSKTAAVHQLKGQNISNCDGDTASLDALIYAKDLFQKIWLFVLLGVGVGAFLHGYVPQEFWYRPLQSFLDQLDGLPD